ncbi:transposase [Crenobacter caeni]|uniref:Transposase n=1 Tax=Crenobacter caeni TaxID=2705474 RepID=A0A6B2KUX7_9NEIS|nr:transposase [Crenobacter caeni]NDV13809.1 transposase [Crenobacter caeni]
MKRRYQNQFKIEALRYLRNVKSISKAARKFDVHMSTLASWQQIGLETFLQREQANLLVDARNQDARALLQRIQRLEQENSVLRQTVRHYFNESDREGFATVPKAQASRNNMRPFAR